MCGCVCGAEGECGEGGVCVRCVEGEECGDGGVCVWVCGEEGSAEMAVCMYVLNSLVSHSLHEKPWSRPLTSCC